MAADTIEFAAKMHIQMHKNKDMKIFKKGILKIHSKYHHKWMEVELGIRLEICQKIYTTGFPGQKFFPLKVRNATIFTQRETAYMHLYQLF